MTSEEPSSGTRLLEVVTGCHKLLEGLEPATRSKAIRMILLAFDEVSEPSHARPMPAGTTSGVADLESMHHVGNLNRRAQNWLRKHDVSEDVLERVLDVESDYALIAHLPADSKREQTISCYLITGIQAMLRTGEAKFQDEDAIALCKTEGCHDRPNHAATRTQLGKRVTGDKDTGFTLTSVGLEQAAVLLKKIVAG